MPNNRCPVPLDCIACELKPVLLIEPDFFLIKCPNCGEALRVVSGLQEDRKAKAIKEWNRKNIKNERAEERH